MKTPNLDRRLKSHDNMCKMNMFSLQDDRYCSCGRDSALVELKVLTDALEWLLKAHWHFQRNNRIDKNSVAGAELEEIIERAKNERIISLKQSTE